MYFVCDLKRHWKLMSKYDSRGIFYFAINLMTLLLYTNMQFIHIVMYKFLPKSKLGSKAMPFERQNKRDSTFLSPALHESLA